MLPSGFTRACEFPCQNMDFHLLKHRVSIACDTDLYTAIAVRPLPGTIFFAFFSKLFIDNKDGLVQIKRISVIRVTGLKILGRVGTHFFSEKKNVILCILKGQMPFKMHKIIFFYQKT